MNKSNILYSIQNLAVHFPVGKGFFTHKSFVKAIDGIDLEIPKNQFFGLVGESGSGKSTLGRAILKAAPISNGKIIYTDGDVTYDMGEIKKNLLKDYRKRAQLIFQDPYAALSPRMTVRDIIAEPLQVLNITKNRTETDEKVRYYAKLCRLNIEHLRRYPHAFSGGQRQRISIARSLATEAKFLVADECVAALDVSIQADILNLLKNLQKELGLTILFISHDLSVISHTCDMVAVMYLGRIVEKAPTRKLFSAPTHPYTRALLSAIPSLDPDHKKSMQKLPGEIPSPINPPSGCTFHTRCPYAEEKCKLEKPIWQHLSGDHHVACHFADKFFSQPQPQ